MVFSNVSFAESTDPTVSSSTSTKKINTANISSDAGVSKAKISNLSEQEKHRKNTKNVAQGLSISESMMLSQSNWGFYASTYAGRGVIDYTDTWSSSTSLSASYRLNSKSSLGISGGYESIVYKKGGDLFNNQADDAGQYGFDDVSVSYSRPQVWSDKYNRLVFYSSLTAPVSRASLRSSLIADASAGFSLRYMPRRSFMITPSVGTYYRQYDLKTADVSGYSVNSPFGVNYSLSGSYVATDWLTGTVSYGQTQRFDYNHDWRTIQYVAVQITGSLTADVNVFAGYRWRDQTLTNEAVFDNSRSSIFTGVGYVF